MQRVDAAYREPTPRWHERHVGLRVTTAVLASVLLAAFAIVAGLYLFVAAALGLAGKCDGDPSSTVCGALSYPLVFGPIVGLTLGWLVATLVPWLVRPKPDLRWIGLGVVIQALTVAGEIVAFGLIGS